MCLHAHTSTCVLPARPNSKVTTTFPAVFMIADSNSLSPAANTISFWTNWGGPVWTVSVVISELSKDEHSVSLSSSDSVSDVSDVSTSCQTHEMIRLILLCILNLKLNYFLKSDGECPSLPPGQVLVFHFHWGWPVAHGAVVFCTASVWREMRRGGLYLGPGDAQCSQHQLSWIWKHT